MHGAGKQVRGRPGGSRRTHAPNVLLRSLQGQPLRDRSTQITTTHEDDMSRVRRKRSARLLAAESNARAKSNTRARRCRRKAQPAPKSRARQARRPRPARAKAKASPKSKEPLKGHECTMRIVYSHGKKAECCYDVVNPEDAIAATLSSNEDEREKLQKRIDKLHRIRSC